MDFDTALIILICLLLFDFIDFGWFIILFVIAMIFCDD